MESFLRILLSVLGATVGTLMIVLVYFLSLSIFGVSEIEQFSKVSLVFVIFIGSVIANSLSALFYTIFSKEKYEEIQTPMLHIFSFNLILFLTALLFYFFRENFQSLALVHVILSVIGSNLILEIFSKEKKDKVSGVYGTLLGAFLLVLILEFLIKKIGDTSFLSFLILPLSYLVISSVKEVAGKVEKALVRN